MPATEPLFQHDAYLRHCTATVVEAGESGVALDRSVFYPLGGGQPGDTGTLRAADGREWRVVDARKGEGGRVVHVLEAGATPPEAGTSVEAIIDWDRRHAHMRMHTCLHLVGSVLRYGVTGGQIAADRGRLDFDTQEEIDKEAVTAAVNALVAANQGVAYLSCRNCRPECCAAAQRLIGVPPPGEVYASMSRGGRSTDGNAVMVLPRLAAVSA